MAADAAQASCRQAWLMLRSGRAASAERALLALRAEFPAQPDIARLLGVALLDQSRCDAAILVLQEAVAAAPASMWNLTDLARAQRAAGHPDAALLTLQGPLAAARAAGAAHPAGGSRLWEAVWLAYGDILVDLERYAPARAAYEHARRSDPCAARIETAAAALTRQDRQGAETIFREILKGDPGHVAASCGLAAVSLAAGHAADALRLLRHALKQAAHLPLTWRGLGQAWGDLGNLSEAQAAACHLLDIEPDNPKNWVLLGNVCTRLMRQGEALQAFEQAARLNPSEIRLRLSIGHLHKTLGNRAACEAAYLQCLDLDPAFGEAYSSLADLKTYVFDAAQIAAMRALIEDDAPDLDQAQLHFALGRAYEHVEDFPAAFDHYAAGNVRRRRTLTFDIGAFEAKSRRVCAFFDARFCAQQATTGHDDAAPIFIVGLPRSGSTLVEQILASHSQVEGTFELPNVLTIVRELDHADARRDGYPERIGAAPYGQFAAWGRRYIAETAALRGDRPRFIDKMPNNFSHVGLIHAMLPRATIIDVRRHPMDACFSAFKQYFAEGQSFSYDLQDLGRYYRCYLRLMEHWDAVLPGLVLHLRYEELVRDLEGNVRRLLEHCGLRFEASCLAFHETRRPVRTASAEQVRRPLYASGVGYWRRFAGRLEPLRQALGSDADC